MSNRFHIIVTGESGRSFALQLSKRKLALSLTASAVTILAICVACYFTAGSYFNSKRLSAKVGKLNARLELSEKSNCDYAEQIAELKKQHKETLAALKKQHQDTLAALKKKHGNLIASQQQDYETQLAEQKTTFDLETTSLQLENVRLMNTAVNDLNQRSRLIETVMDTIGVTIKKAPATKKQENSGGPFIPDNEKSYDNLLQQVDNYLKTIRTMPLGKPVNGRISSRFGKRVDPVNNKKAIHEGVDIKGARGDHILATAGGKVIKAMKNGGYGNYVEIDHGNGYITAYAHMQSYLVKKGDHVKQGQVIGQVGSTGRSTGPHLHYEIRLNNKPIDPEKFMKVADISHTIKTNQNKK